LFVTTFDVHNLDNSVSGVAGDSAVVVSVSGHVDVSVVTPRGSPAVLDEPVVLPTHGSVSDGQYCVVQSVGAASGLVVHTTGVELERVVAGVDGDGDRADIGDCFLQFGLIAIGQLGVRGDGGNWSVRSLLAGSFSSVSGFVWVAGF